VVLREVAGVHLVPEPAGAGVGGEAAHDDLEKRGLAEAVGADDGDALPAPDGERHVPQHPACPERLRDVRELQHVAPARALRDEAKSGARRELSSSSSTSIFSICFSRLWACLAFVALAPKRSTNARFSAMIFSARAISASFRARVAAFSTTKAE